MEYRKLVDAVSEEEAKNLYDTFAVPASSAPIFQASNSLPRTPPLTAALATRYHYVIPWEDTAL